MLDSNEGLFKSQRGINTVEVVIILAIPGPGNSI